MPRFLAAGVSLALTLSACRSSDAKFDPWASDDGDAWWSADSGDGEIQSEDLDQDGWSASDDCDDANASVHPAAEELCDGIDNDCDGEVDEGVLSTWYADSDGDDFGDEANTVESCEAPPGYGAVAEDCDDGRADVYPGAPEQCDQLDNDCDGELDEEVLSTWYADTDTDGFGNPDVVIEDCDPPSGYIADASDCDDSSGAVFPGADEWCDGIDNDCDGNIDEDAIDEIDFFLDADGDGFGDPEQEVESCEQPTGYVADDDDCDDMKSDVHPDAIEICDEVDNDCDGDIDDADSSLDAATWYGDSDGDGYGGTSFSQIACEAPANFVATSDDCNDLADDIHPGADEICNTIDDDCDGDIDDADPSLDTSTGGVWYTDSDGDSFGDSGAVVMACEQPSGTTEDDTDCDDTDSAVHPDAEEVCDGVDNNCDGDVDSGYPDADGDGTANCVDSTVFSDDFNDSNWDDWTTVDLDGDSDPEWTMNGFTLSEDSDRAFAIAIGPDLGELESYTISVEAWSGGYYNNALGIVFAYQDEDNMMLLLWDDFNGFYGDYSPDGEIELWEVSGGTWTQSASDDDSDDYIMDYGTWTDLSLSVDGSEISFSADGSTYFQHSYTGATPLGADHIGVFSYDNDQGITFDDFEVTQP